MNTAWDDLGRRQIRGIVLHRMLGTLEGTDSYFRTVMSPPQTPALRLPPVVAETKLADIGQFYTLTAHAEESYIRTGAAHTARTDFGIGVGKIYQWTPLESNMAPWASGPADGIKGDAVAFYDAYGKGKPIDVSVCNRDCASIEIEGNYDTLMPPADWDRLVELVAWIAAHYCGATVVSWPKNRDGIHLLLAHNEWTNDKPCPGIWVLSNVNRLIDDVRERLAS